MIVQAVGDTVVTGTLILFLPTLKSYVRFTISVLRILHLGDHISTLFYLKNTRSALYCITSIVTVQRVSDVPTLEGYKIGSTNEFLSARNLSNTIFTIASTYVS